ncbi:histidine phosphatase family protein [Actinoplanes friuliensis]|uniref:Phosphoglycerate mutase n=1 Tax=Actinoplanes friuliensis DSM 7358 TaxID=1246995 RepID=U5W0T5_9ACTN|nr:histidine phosphatase family protein [Actinoplanes friuliensis]AGZ42617.1 phosphoglycerate mutase [Actinoplanes friuliensis DSM 7358]
MSGPRLLASAATPGLRRAVFGGDDDLDEGGLRAALALTTDLGGRADVWFSAPSQAALQTARALGHDDPVVEHALADPDYGQWTGLGLGDIAGTDPEGLQSWLTDPEATPHGGESLAAVRQRAGAWLDKQAEQRIVAVAHPVVVRAALAHALGLSDDGVWQLDVSPLSLIRLTHRADRWHVSFPPAG